MTTEERVEKLERELARAKRWNRWLLPVGLTVAGCVAVCAVALRPAPAREQASDEPVKEIRASKLTLVDENGKWRARLVVDKDWVGLCLYDEKGTQRATLNASNDGEGLCLNGKNLKLRADLSGAKDRGTLRLYDEKGETIWSAPR